MGVLPAPLQGQIGTVIVGRIEDALSREPVTGVRVFSHDSTAVTYTDSLGAFVLVLPPGIDRTVHTEHVGYLYQVFELAPEAEARMNVLLIDQAPIELEGFDVVTEQAITTLIGNLQDRRNAFPGATSVFDRTWFERFAPHGTALDVARLRFPGIGPCPDTDKPMRGACYGQGGVATSFSYEAPPTSYVKVCIDGWEMDARALDVMPNEDVALIEVFRTFSLKQINVYTRQYLLLMARDERTVMAPIEYQGC